MVSEKNRLLRCVPFDAHHGASKQPRCPLIYTAKVFSCPVSLDEEGLFIPAFSTGALCCEHVQFLGASCACFTGYFMLCLLRTAVPCRNGCFAPENVSCVRRNSTFALLIYPLCSAPFRTQLGIVSLDPPDGNRCVTQIRPTRVLPPRQRRRPERPKHRSSGWCGRG